MGVTLSLQSGSQRLRPAVVLELLKPITWFPPMWAFACGAVSAGGSLRDQWPVLLAGVLVAGPLVCGASQAVNDWFDREVDAVNEPRRPIPSGRLPGRSGLAVAVGWSLLSLAAGALLGARGFVATLVAVALAWAYSAPPIRLKANGWWGNAACGLSYETLAWITGAVVATGGRAPATAILVVALLYGLGAHGILTLNDFKAIDGDQRFGVRSLPVQLGPQRAALVACAVMLVPQLVVVGILFSLGTYVSAALVLALVVLQLPLMRRFLGAVRERALWYSAVGVPVYVTGMMVAAFALRHAGASA